MTSSYDRMLPPHRRRSAAAPPPLNGAAGKEGCCPGKEEGPRRSDNHEGRRGHRPRPRALKLKRFARPNTGPTNTLPASSRHPPDTQVFRATLHELAACAAHDTAEVSAEINPEISAEVGADIWRVLARGATYEVQRVTLRVL